ncbi:Aste57867_8681 [Aphanomyces stellatus]|uniref:Aste57867_8681 protein n=1 Tax=Aphanomyces stellatus TaxID=120398 RepID=A0A485KKZ0_9STRA|nr:hypothetical protein As57867_008647 [Aphanomyces stellatus]VFT85567.1 Aste57867_8681 [Aphanomyces stellatus]
MQALIQPESPTSSSSSSASYYERHRARLLENQRLYRQRNRDKLKQIHKAYYQKHRERIVTTKQEKWHLAQALKKTRQRMSLKLILCHPTAAISTPQRRDKQLPMHDKHSLALLAA